MAAGGLEIGLRDMAVFTPVVDFDDFVAFHSVVR
jgi:hypothetical protein